MKYLAVLYAGFKPLQVFYKQTIFRTSQQAKKKFQTLIGILQTQANLMIMIISLPFQTLIGILQTCHHSHYCGHCSDGFKPLQVFYKLKNQALNGLMDVCFKPLQVFYKLILSSCLKSICFKFQTLIGILQTLLEFDQRTHFRSFKPLQVFYKLTIAAPTYDLYKGFKPLQVFYKHKNELQIHF